MRRAIIVLFTLGLVLALTPLTPARAFITDFFDGEASGNAVYEEFAIHPEAIYDQTTDQTIVAYQGYAMNPFVAAYDHATKLWSAPVQVGTSSISDDAHGGPSLVVDAEGYIHIFYGAHGGALRHARTVLPHDPAAWKYLSSVTFETSTTSGMRTTTAPATYPQPVLEPDGDLRLFYRSSESGSGNGSWYSITSTSGVGPWQSRELALGGRLGVEGWYANFTQDAATGDMHTGFFLRDYVNGKIDFYVRRNAYYLRRDHTSGEWFNAAGESAPTTRTQEYLDSTCMVYNSGTDYVNQVVANSIDGEPCLLFVTGHQSPSPEYTWLFTRWSSTENTWSAPVKIADTDNLFDSGCFTVLDDGTIEAYLTVGGFADENTVLDEARQATRGGDIVRFVSEDGGASFARDATLKSSPGPWARYNNPQIVSNHQGETDVFFSEWDNDFSNYVHKVFLWNDGRFALREISPRSERLAGPNRTDTAVAVAQEAFPTGSKTVLIASQDSFPDALCGVPLAHAMKAPLLLTGKNSMDAGTIAEIKRLGATEALILGSDGVVSEGVATKLKGLVGATTVDRLGGGNRYATSVLIQKRLASLKGQPNTVVLASSKDFPDALAISPYAARKSMPILLTEPSGLPAAISAAIKSTGAQSTIIVGGAAAVSPAVEVSVGAITSEVTRLGGSNRWETACVINATATANGLSMERFVVCTGENFPDALTGGVLAARCNAPLVLTGRDTVADPTRALFEPRPETIVWYVLGADAAVSSTVENTIASLLAE